MSLRRRGGLWLALCHDSEQVLSLLRATGPRSRGADVPGDRRAVFRRRMDGRLGACQDPQVWG